MNDTFASLTLNSVPRLVSSFGYAFNAVEPEYIEPDFGLRTTLNEVNPESLDTVDTRNIDVVTKQRRTHLNQGSHISEFGLNTDLDWIRHVSGVPIANSLASRMAGADSLHVTKDVPLLGLGSLCERLLKSYESDSYKRYFGFIDQMRPLKDSDPTVRKLNKQVSAMLATRERAKIAIAHPDFPDQSVEMYKIQGNGEARSFEELSLDEVYAFSDEAFPSGNMDPNSVHIVPLDGDGRAVGRRMTLHSYLVAQVHESGSTFVLSLGRWFRVESGYIEQLQSRIVTIPDISNTLQLPAFQRREREESFNSRTATAKGWLLLDKKMFAFGGSNNRIEACDLLTPERHFICVKKMESSATLSHLFAQGSVSATLLKKETAYKEMVAKLFESQWITKQYSSAPTPTFVFAMSTKKPGKVADELFFFSLVNLVQHAEAIRLLGFKVAVCKIVQF